MRVIFRPLVWLGPITPEDRRRSRATFKAGWENTVYLLKDELHWLQADEVIIQADFTESDIRLDGLPRANAKQPNFPGAKISFNSSVGWTAYQTDSCVFWQHNVRSIALGLGALRAVNRYGITARDEQYAGFRALPPKPPAETTFKTSTEVLTWMRDIAGFEGAEGLSVKALAKILAARLHPDKGGDPAMWDKYDQARQVLEKEGLL